MLTQPDKANTVECCGSLLGALTSRNMLLEPWVRQEWMRSGPAGFWILWIVLGHVYPQPRLSRGQPECTKTWCWCSVELCQKLAGGFAPKQTSALAMFHLMTSGVETQLRCPNGLRWSKHAHKFLIPVSPQGLPNQASFLAVPMLREQVCEIFVLAILILKAKNPMMPPL